MRGTSCLNRKTKKLSGFGIKNIALSKSKSSRRVGLDIGSQTVKVIELSGPSEKSALSGFGVKNISNLSARDAGDSIREMMSKAEISEKSVTISLSGPSVIVRFISLPKMDEQSLKGAIKFEAGKFIPFDINDCVIDHKIIGKDDRENKLNVLLVAVKRDVLLGKIKMVEDAGLTVRIVDVDVFAMANAFMKCVSVPSEKTVALINIGASLTNLSILRGQSIYFARDLGIGGKNFNAAISKILGLDEKDAEELKVRPGNRIDEVAGLTKPVLNSLLDEVKLSFSYYENQSGKNIDEVYVSGGGSGIVGLSDVFQENLGSKPSVWNPMQSIDTASLASDKELLGKTGSSFAIAMGLALR